MSQLTSRQARPESESVRTTDRPRTGRSEFSSALWQTLAENLSEEAVREGKRREEEEVRRRQEPYGFD